MSKLSKIENLKKNIVDLDKKIEKLNFQKEVYNQQLKFLEESLTTEGKTP